MSGLMSNHSEPSSVAGAIDRIAHPVATRIDGFLSAEIERWSSLDPTLVDPLESLRSLVLAGGKRLRPAFAYWGFVGAGGDPLDPLIIDGGAALELLHSFALVHDDVMDDSPRRRGNDAVHVQFESQHEKEGWVGEPRRFGEGVAILVGDMAFVYADHLMSRAPRPAMDVFTELRIELNVGQYLDLSASVRSDATLPMAQKIAQYKSGKYTVERPLHLGAALADRFDDLAKSFTAYGLPVGEAFQLRDDLLGAFGDPSVIGKPVGGDLREGKPTALLALARERATGADAKLLARYGAPDLSDDEIAALQQVLTDTNARADVTKRIDDLVVIGLEGLATADITSEAKQRLEELAYFVAGRQH